MKIYSIAVIAGDGIGPEVIAEGIKVLNAVAKLDSSFTFSLFATIHSSALDIPRKRAT